MHSVGSFSAEAEKDLDTWNAAINAVVSQPGPLRPWWFEKFGCGAGALRVEKGSGSLHKEAELLLEGSVLRFLALRHQLAAQRRKASVKLKPRGT